MTREELNALVKGFPLAWTEEEAKRGKALDLSDGGSKNSSGSDRSSGSAENDDDNDDDDLDATRVLYLTQNYKLEKPLLMRAKVVRGFGRGSAEMGLPTANLDPAEVSLNWQKEMNDDTIDVENIPLGVYFGYCRLEGDDDSDKKIAVLNVGRRPSFVDKKDYENDVTVEVHCVEKNEDGLAFENGKKQFYGETMSVECLGFVRPEMKFNGLDELITRIKTDVGLSKNSLTKMTGV
jgi:riboflavin kinase